MVLALWLPAFFGGALTSRAALQFDVFLGYDWIVPQASWFPVVCEIKNDGPSFVGTVELDGGRFDQDQTRRAVVELPTGTLKRFVIPVFAASRGFGAWDVRLLDERGKVRAEQTGLRARRQITSNAPLLGALVRTPGGTPVLRPILPQDASLQPAAARLLPAVFPDNPVVLEGLDCLYLNSEKALDLKVNQVKALLRLAPWRRPPDRGRRANFRDYRDAVVAQRAALRTERHQDGASSSGASAMAAERDLADDFR